MVPDGLASRRQRLKPSAPTCDAAVRCCRWRSGGGVVTFITTFSDFRRLETDVTACDGAGAGGGDARPDEHLGPLLGVGRERGGLSALSQHDPVPSLEYIESETTCGTEASGPRTDESRDARHARNVSDGRSWRCSVATGTELATGRGEVRFSVASEVSVSAYVNGPQREARSASVVAAVALVAALTTDLNIT